MKQNNFGRFLLVIAIIVWALVEIYPPTSRDLVKEFASRATKKDATFTNILMQAEAMQKAGTNNEFAALELAAGKVHAVVAQVQHEVGRVGLGARAVVGEDPERPVGHALDA